ncbi:MAG: hypothetical protein HYX61_08510 [Gammaproteobacteria bacterium]|jgi:hypothetical protein|nr:hypothetical protein [Gammaproteobacteria bacterium]
MYLGPETIAEISEDLIIILSQLDSVQRELSFALSTQVSSTEQWPLAPELYEHVDQILLHYPKAVERYKNVAFILESTITTSKINEDDLSILSQSEIPKMVKLAQKLLK